jgi:hypothetical protein
MPRQPTVTALPHLLFRTTPRDRYLAAMLHEHRAMTATQIAMLAFPSLRAANRRLKELAALAVVDRTRVRTSVHAAGSYLYTLGPAGALLVGAAHDLSAKELRYDRGVLLRQAARPDLPHTLGCNALMIRLAVRTTIDPSLRLTAWWGPISCLRLWGDVIRPDAYAVTNHRDQATGWFLEYDTGTESITQLAGKHCAPTDASPKPTPATGPFSSTCPPPPGKRACTRSSAPPTQTHVRLPSPLALTRTSPHPHGA